MLYFMKVQGNQSSAEESMERRIVTPDTIKTLLMTAQSITNRKYPCKTKQRSWQSHDTREWPYRVSLIQVRLHRSPVISECLQTNERRTVQIHLMSPVVLVRRDVEGNKLPNSLQVTSRCSYTWKCIKRFYFRQTSWLSLPSVWWYPVHTVRVMILSSINTVLDPERLTKSWPASVCSHARLAPATRYPRWWTIKARLNSPPPAARAGNSSWTHNRDDTVAADPCTSLQ